MQEPHSRARQLNRKQWQGFTIVELLIVVLVITILAAITIVSYNGITNSAKEATLKSDLQTASAKIAQQLMRNNKLPTTADELSRSKETVFSYKLLGREYCLSATSVDGKFGPYHIKNGGSISSGKCPTVVTALTSGYGHVCAVADDKPYCWGTGQYGRL